MSRGCSGIDALYELALYLITSSWKIVFLYLAKQSMLSRFAAKACFVGAERIFHCTPQRLFSTFFAQKTHHNHVGIARVTLLGLLVNKMLIMRFYTENWLFSFCQRFEDYAVLALVVLVVLCSLTVRCVSAYFVCIFCFRESVFSYHHLVLNFVYTRKTVGLRALGLFLLFLT